MPKQTEGVITRLLAHVRALLAEDWIGGAGKRLRDTTAKVSRFAEEHGLRPKEVLDEGVELGRVKLEGLAYKDYAAATKDFAEAEQKKIDYELQRRTLDLKVRKEEAETRAAELKVMDAEIELLKKLKEAGVVLHRDDKGNLSVLRAPEDCDLTDLYTRRSDVAAAPTQIYLTDPSDFTLENIRKLIASGDDKVDNQIRVTQRGIAFLSQIVGADGDLDSLAFRLETFCAGNDYVGPQAASDDEFVGRLYACLQKNWPDPIDAYIDYF